MAIGEFDKSKEEESRYFLKRGGDKGALLLRSYTIFPQFISLVVVTIVDSDDTFFYSCGALLEASRKKPKEVLLLLLVEDANCSALLSRGVTCSQAF